MDASHPTPAPTVGTSSTTRGLHYCDQETRLKSHHAAFANATPPPVIMSALPLSFDYTSIPPTFQWPVKFCFSNAVVAFVLGVVTGNVSQVDRVWTFLPTIYTAYYALLPLWPSKSPLPLFPYVPEIVNPAVVERFSPRALLMFGLVVSTVSLTYLNHTN